MPIIRDLLVKIGFLSDGRGLKDVESNITRLKHSALLIGEAIAGAEFAMFELLKTTAEEAFEIKRLSGVMGIATNDFQLLAKAAEMSEVDMESFTLAMRRFGVVTGEAMRGGKQQIKDFAAIGVTTFKNANGTTKNQVQLLQEVADKLVAIKTPQERLAAAYKLFGRQGIQIVNFLSKGAKGIRELTKEVGEFGYIFTPEDMKQSEKFVENLKLTKLFLKGLKDEVGVRLLPAVNKYVEAMKDWVRQNRELIVQNIEGKIKGINRFLRSAWVALSFIYNIITKLIDKIGGMNTVLTIAGVLFGIITGAKIIRGLWGLVAPIKNIALALKSMDFWAALSAEALLGIGLAAYLAYDDVKNFHEGNKSLVGDLSKKYPELAKVIVWVVDSMVKDIRFVIAVVEDMIEKFELLGRVVLDIGKKIANFFQKGNENMAQFSNSMGGAAIGMPAGAFASNLINKSLPISSGNKAIKSSITNNVNINVPQGTPQNQQNWFKNEMQKQLDSWHQETMRGVMNALQPVEN